MRPPLLRGGGLGGRGPLGQSARRTRERLSTPCHRRHM